MRRLVLLSILLLAACGGNDDDAPTIPDRTVVLTFDDAVRNHLTLVAPLLEERGFGATFYVSSVWMEKEPEYSLTWKELGELHRRGFEIGDHSRTHGPFFIPAVSGRLSEEIAWMRARFRAAGIAEPTTFAWPGSAWGPEALGRLREAGYRFGRRGRLPERPPGHPRVDERHAYDPARHDPMLIPSFDVGQDWTLGDYRRALALARGGRAVVLQFHGVPDPRNKWVSVMPETFRAVLDLLKEGGYTVVALRDLERWVDPSVRPDDPYAARRVPETW
jgi:peptidoglycan/xylan/chitin deacetylase (PgdA/CDA1 family)